MKTTRSQVAKVPQAHIGLNDARVLLTMVTAYLLYLRKAVPPSPKQETQLRVLRSVQQRLSALLASPQKAEEKPAVPTAAAARFAVHVAASPVWAREEQPCAGTKDRLSP